MDQNSQIKKDLISLALLPDDEIDTSEIPQRLDFSSARRARFFNLIERSYDVRAIANWCLEKLKAEGRIETQMWMNKIVYFIHQLALTKYRTLLTPARVEAWDHGPVFREIYFGIPKGAEMRPFTRYNSKARKRELAAEDFSPIDLGIFEDAWTRYGHLNAPRLRAISHAPDSPWSLVWNSKGDKRHGLEIDVPAIIGLIGQGYGNSEKTE